MFTLRSGVADGLSQGGLMPSDPAMAGPASAADHSLRSGAAFAGKTPRLLKQITSARPKDGLVNRPDGLRNGVLNSQGCPAR